LKTILRYLSVVLMFGLISCQPNNPDAQQIIDEVILKHGGMRYENSKISFDFRGKHFSRKRSDGKFIYRKVSTDTSGIITVDEMDNNIFDRGVDGKLMELSDKEREGGRASLNSVIYFALLPFRLNDESVGKKYLGTYNVKGSDYIKVEITFAQEGGGEDFDDIYVYWIHEQNKTLDYLAYSFAERKTTGYRFRSFYNRREVNGIIFQDYENYKPENSADFYPGDMDRMFADGSLELLSKIELENVQVE